MMNGSSGFKKTLSHPNLVNNSNTTGPVTDIFQELPGFQVIKIVIYVVILLLSFTGNTLVILVVCRHKRMLTPSNILILNLAVCDILMPITSIPFDLVYEESDYRWPYGKVLCKALWPTATLAATSASLTLSVLSLARYRVIMHPYKPRLTKKQIKLAILITHVFSLALVIPYSYVLGMSSDGNDCEEKWAQFSYRQAYTMALFLVQYGIPLPFMTAMYTMALMNLYSTSEKASGFGKLKTSKRKTAVGFKEVYILNLGLRKDRDLNLRATKMFMTVVIVFAICMLPNQVLWLWSDYGRGFENENFNTAAIICRFFTYTNTVCNALIYSLFSKDFSRGYKAVFRALHFTKFRKTIAICGHRMKRNCIETKHSLQQQIEVTPFASSRKSREMKHNISCHTSLNQNYTTLDLGKRKQSTLSKKTSSCVDEFEDRKLSTSDTFLRPRSRTHCDVFSNARNSNSSKKACEIKIISSGRTSTPEEGHSLTKSHGDKLTEVEGVLEELEKSVNRKKKRSEETIVEFIQNLKETDC